MGLGPDEKSMIRPVSMRAIGACDEWSLVALTDVTEALEL